MLAVIVGPVAQRVGVQMGVGQGGGTGVQAAVINGKVLGRGALQKVPVVRNGDPRRVQCL